jgi:sporulation protein YunB
MSAQQFRSTSTKPHKRMSRWVYVVTCIWIFAAATLILAEVKLRPSISAAAQAVATRAATDALATAVTEEMARETSYSRILHVEKDATGTFNEANFDFPAVIQVQTLAVARANDHLRQLGHESFRIPLLQSVGGALFSSVGPTLPVRTYLVGSAHSSIQAEVKSVGINQTVHMLYLDLTAQVNVVAPLISKPTQVHSRVMLAYVIFNGKVPNTFFGQPPTWTPQPNP